MLVCRTGAGTSLGEISDSLALKPPATAFETGIRNFGLLILRLAILMVLFVLLVNALFHRPWLESFLFAVALAVGLTPELLPMVVSVTLARGALRMAKERVIVKRLAAVHDLGSMDVLCTDKTGTLTEAQIRLEKHLDPLGRESARVLELAFLNSSMETGLKSPLDEAILRHAEVDVSRWAKIDEVPFDFERRLRLGARRRRARSGCSSSRGPSRTCCGTARGTRPTVRGTLLPLDEAARRDAVAQRFEVAQPGGIPRPGDRLEGDGPETSPHAVVDDETELVFAGFAAFEDPPKASAADAVARAGRERRHGQDRDRRQRARDPARVRRAGPSRHRSAHGRRDPRDDRPRARGTRRRRESLLPRHAAAEEPRDPGASEPPPRRRLSGRRNQRRAVPPFGGCRDLRGRRG